VSKCLSKLQHVQWIHLLLYIHYLMLSSVSTCFIARCAYTLRYFAKLYLNLPNRRFISLHPCHNIAYTPYVGVYMFIENQCPCLHYLYVRRTYSTESEKYNKQDTFFPSALVSYSCTLLSAARRRAIICYGFKKNNMIYRGSIFLYKKKRFYPKLLFSIL
jgi:hypothetical protein